MKMKSGIYMIKCKETGKIYVGLSKNMKSRYQVHIADLKRGKHGNPYMQNAYKKYGKEAFEFSILEYCEEEKLHERENFWINHLDSSNSDVGFNIIVDPKREKSRLDKCNSVPYKEKMRDVINKKWEDPDFAKKNLEAIKKSHEERKARGETLSILTEESKKKSYESCHTPEFLKGLSERAKKQQENPEYRAASLKHLEKGRNSQKGKENIKKSREMQQTPEYRTKVSEKSKEVWKRRKKESRAKKREEAGVSESISKGLKEYFNTEEGKKQVNKTAKSRWENPETREKYIKGMKERRQEPEYKKMLSDKAKARWADPEFKARVSEKIRLSKEKK